jgi:hypothetical protein
MAGVGFGRNSGDSQTNARGQLQLRLRQWQADTNVAGVQGQDALARLPDEERKE